MIKMAFKYFFSTPMRDIRNACREYRTIVRNCNNLHMQLVCAHHALAIDVPEKNMFQNNQACIQYKYLNQMLNYGMDDGEKIAYAMKVCLNFSNQIACSNVACPYIAKNLTYFQALENYNAARKNKRNFWSRKFMQTK